MYLNYLVIASSVASIVTAQTACTLVKNKNPGPKNETICREYGRVNVKHDARGRLFLNYSHDQCSLECVQDDSCTSYGYTNSTQTCRTYTEKLVQQSFVKDNTSSTIYSNYACDKLAGPCSLTNPSFETAYDGKYFGNGLGLQYAPWITRLRFKDSQDNTSVGFVNVETNSDTIGRKAPTPYGNRFFRMHSINTTEFLIYQEVELALNTVYNLTFAYNFYRYSGQPDGYGINGYAIVSFIRGREIGYVAFSNATTDADGVWKTGSIQFNITEYPSATITLGVSPPISSIVNYSDFLFDNIQVTAIGPT